MRFFAIVILSAATANADTPFLPADDAYTTVRLRPLIPDGKPIGELPVPGTPEPGAGLLVAGAVLLLGGRRRG